MSEKDEVREVYSAESMFDAEHMRYMLAEAEISSRVTGAPLQSIIGELPAQLSAPGIWVRNEDFDAARAIIDEEVAKLKEKRDLRSAWNCDTCGEQNVPEFAICWYCQRPQVADEA